MTRNTDASRRAASVRGRSKCVPLCRLAHTLIAQRTHLGIMLWADYVNTKDNMADGMSRADLVAPLTSKFRLAKVDPVLPVIISPWPAEETDDYVEWKFRNNEKMRDLE